MADEPAPSRLPAMRPGKERRSPPPEQAASAFVAFALLLGGAAAAIFLAGGADQGNLGVFLLGAGVALLIGSPRVRVPWTVWLAAAAFLGCSAASLLPARWFHLPLWRQNLAGVPDLPLPDTVSAAPTQTLFWLAVLALSTLTALFTLTQPMRSRDLFTLALLAVGVCGVYAALSIFAKLSGWVYPFSGGATFGFLPNRNHTATLLVTGSLLAVGILGVAFREHRWLAVDLAVASLGLCVVGLCFFSESRAGVIFLGLGLAAWVAGLGRRHRDRPLLLAVIVVTLLSGGLFLSLKSGARDRLLRSVAASGDFRQGREASNAVHPPERPGGELSADDRLRIYRDTLGLIRAAPLTGTGLGTFALVFPPYRRASASDTLVLHPESDWLMVAAETGLPALGCLTWLGFLVIRIWRPAREHPSWPLRWAFFVAAGVAAAHGLVDVPAHRAAVGWWVLTLAGLALQPGRLPKDHQVTTVDRRATRGIFAGGGLLAIFLGGQLVRAEWFGGPPLPPYVAKIAQEQVARTSQRGDLEGAMAQSRQAVAACPLDSFLYYQLGLLLLRDDDNDAEVDRAFHLQRVLNPCAPLIPDLQATAWMPIDAGRSATLFTEALEREERLRNMAGHDEKPLVFWRGILQRTRAFPAVQEHLWPPAAARGPEFLLTWLEEGDAAIVKARLSSWAQNADLLASSDPGQRERLVSVWKAKGDPAVLQTFLEASGAGWPRK